MLTPEYLDHVPDTVVAYYEQAETDILCDMAERISAMDYYIPSVQWQERKLQEMGLCHDEIMARLSAITGKTTRELERILEAAGAEALRADMDVYRSAGYKLGAVTASPFFKATIRAGLIKTSGLFKNLTRTTANTATRQFENALDRAYMQVHTGAFSPQRAVEIAVQDLSRQGVGAITYPSGHTDKVDVAVRRAVVTGVNQTSAILQDELAAELGCDLVEVSAHFGARPTHAEWQGQVYSRSGKTPGYDHFADATGYGTGDGLCGWGCRHNFFPYIEGTPRTYTQKDLEERANKTVTYNGRELTEYDATQQQRYIERQTRRWGREVEAMRAAGLDPSRANAKVREWKARNADFCSQTGLKRQYGREKFAPLITGRNPIHGIRTPTIATRENREQKYLDNLLSRKVGLRRAHKDIITAIPSRGDWAYIRHGSVELKDLAALTAVTKDEFALFADAERSLLVHGGAGVWQIPESAWDEISKHKLVWVGHSHPTTVNPRASTEDRITLREYFTWQEKSTIIDMKGNTREFTGLVVDEINDMLGVK